MLQTRTWLLIAALNGLLAMAAGAFGAHGLEVLAPAPDLAAFRTAAQYHMYHALALLAVAWRAGAQPGAWQTAAAGWLFAAGIVLFSGSLYVLGATGSRALVWLTPAGGLSLIAGWAAFAWAAIRTGKPQG